jgi:hypothetical protein
MNLTNHLSAKIYSWSTNKKRIIFYSAWFIIGLVQAWGTELFDDEAYYWVYSKFLDWGYFDHPPMIAVLVKLGYFIFPSELGVRLFIVLIGTASIFFIEQLTKPKDLLLFYAIVLNMAVLQIGGIMAVPDIPLLFFTVLFFIAYKNFVEKNGFKEAIFLSIVISLLLYSKYHGILIIFFTLLSNLSLFKKPLTYLVIFLSVALFMPHIFWQILHGFPSINYHLFERVSPPYNISFTTDFLLGQLLIAGPFVGWLIIWSALKYKPSSPVEKAMYWSIIGIYALFFLSSFKSRTEANWTIPLIAPLIVLAYQYLNVNQQKTKWVYRLMPYTLAVIFIIRLYMFLDIKPFKIMPKDEFHQNKTWAASIKKESKGLPVVFTNSYQRASKYWFYSGDTSFSLNTYKYRRSNYNFWPLEDRLQGRKIMMIGSSGAEFMVDTLVTSRMKMSYKNINPFYSFSQVVLNQSFIKLYKEQTLHAFLDVSYNPKDNTYKNLEDLKPYVMLMIYQSPKDSVLVINTGTRLSVTSDKIMNAYIDIDLPKLKSKKYTIRWGLQNSFDEPTINSRAFASKDFVMEK